MLNFKDNPKMLMNIKKSTFVIYMVGALVVGYLGNEYVGSSNGDIKAPVWQPIATKTYKNYKYSHIDYRQPQYTNVILNEEMLNSVKQDIKKGLIIVANKDFGVEIGDAVKYTADDHIWLLVSHKDPTHKFEEIK